MTLVSNLKQHLHIITTSLCLLLILIGIFLLQTNQGATPILFISAFVIGGLPVSQGRSDRIICG